MSAHVPHNLSTGKPNFCVRCKVNILSNEVLLIQLFKYILFIMIDNDFCNDYANIEIKVKPVSFDNTHF